MFASRYNYGRELQDRANQMKERHRTEWEALKEANQSERTAIKDRMSPTMKARSAQVKAEFKPIWARMFQEHDMERRAFDRADKSIIGAIWHGAAVFKELALDGNTLGGFVAAFSKEERRAIIQRKHDRERQALGKKVRNRIQAELKELKAQFDREFTDARQGFLSRCASLQGTQDQELENLRAAWREYNSKRKAAMMRTKSRVHKLGEEQEQVMQQGRGLNLEP